MATLIVQDVDQTWLVDVEPGERLVVGRSPDCDLPIRANRASRRHAEIRGSEGRHVLVDLGSTNGTLLNGAPLNGEALLHDHDRIDAGGCMILYRGGLPRAEGR